MSFFIFNKLLKFGTQPLQSSLIVDNIVNKIKIKKSTRLLNNFELDMVKLNKQSYQTVVSRIDIDNYKYQPRLSNQEVAVYFNNNKIYIIYKGTSNKENVITDLKLIHNIRDRSFKRALNFHDNIKNMFSNREIIVSGHSLGGALAMFVSYNRRLRGVVFNSFTPNLIGTLHTILKNTPLITKIVNRDDILSNKQIILEPNKLIVLVSKFNKRGLFENHTIDTFLTNNNFIF